MNNDSQRLYNIVLTVSNNCNIDLNEITRRKQWEKEKRDFVSQVSDPMYALLDFGFTKEEIRQFESSVDLTLHYALFLYVIKKEAKKTKNPKDCRKRIIREWRTEKVFDNLNEMRDIILDDFFEKKGGIVFRKNS